MFGGEKTEKSKLVQQRRLDVGPYYEIIRTRSGEVGVVYDPGDQWSMREVVLHVVVSNPGSPSDTALSILADHFDIAPRRALAAAFGTHQSTEEELLSKFYAPFLQEFILPAMADMPCDSSFMISSEDVREWANVKLKTGGVRW